MIKQGDNCATNIIQLQNYNIVKPKSTFSRYFFLLLSVLYKKIYYICKQSYNIYGKSNK